MSSDALIVLTLLVLGYALVSGRLAHSVVTPAMAFAAVGLLAGPHVLGIFELPIDSHAFKELADAALTVLLFTEASRLDVTALLRRRALPLRLLGVGLPLTMVLGTALALLLIGSLGFWEAAALAVVLAPTDAALGESVVSDRRVPGVVRRSLRAESGLNDGLALPFLIIALAFAEQGADGGSLGHWVWFIVRTIGVSVAVGAVIGVVGGLLLARGARSGSIVERFAELSILALALLTFAVVEQLDGSGFVGAFVAGGALGAVAPKVAVGEETTAAALGELLALVVFALFGASILQPAFASVDARVLVYAVLSLTVVRMLPVALALIGTGFSRATTLYLGWFGPRGIASLIFGLLLIEEADLPGTGVIVQTVVVTVALSILAHGMTAPRGAAVYAAAVGALRRKRPGAPEFSGPERERPPTARGSS